MVTFEQVDSWQKDCVPQAHMENVIWKHESFFMVIYAFKEKEMTVKTF